MRYESSKSKAEGSALSRAIANSQNENKIVSLSYRLLNALQIHNAISTCRHCTASTCRSDGRFQPYFWIH